MKKKRSMITAVVIVVFIRLFSAFSFVAYINSLPLHQPNNKDINAHAYPTVHEALENGLQTKAYKYVEVNGTAFAVCDTSLSKYACQYLYKAENGWQLITEYVCDNPLLNETESSYAYTTRIYDFKGKYMVCVSQNIYSYNKNGEIKVTDSLNSSFTPLAYKSGNGYDTKYWYVCLDELNEDYTLFINGEAVYKYEGDNLKAKFNNFIDQLSEK